VDFPHIVTFVKQQFACKETACCIGENLCRRLFKGTREKNTRWWPSV